MTAMDAGPLGMRRAVGRAPAPAHPPAEAHPQADPQPTFGQQMLYRVPGAQS
ncbi:hypothetical protein GCM10022379_18530 [Micromonospora maritima]